MFRRFLWFAFSFLLLSLQHELLSHPLTHLADLKARQQSSLKPPAVEIACIECSLLASATNIVAGSVPPAMCNAVAAERVAFEPAARYVCAPSYYQSRAPPLFLWIA
jgi:hypothetical protein